MGHTAEPGACCLTVSGLVVRLDGGPRLLLHPHKRYGLLLQPGGHVDPGEHPWPAVLRELREEAGIVPEQLEVLQPAGFGPAAGSFPVPMAVEVMEVEPGRVHSDLVFGLVLTGSPRHRPAEGESAELLWVPLAGGDEPAVPEHLRRLAARLDRLLTSWAPVPAGAYGTEVASPSAR